MSFITDAKPQFEKTIEHVQTELRMIRTGRATPALVEDMQIEHYGAMQPLKQLASIGTPDARTIQIEPWDATAVQAIETAIQKSEIGINPNVDGKIIRLAMPMMTEEMRLEMVKKMKGKLEEGKVSVRQIREEVKKKIEKQEGVGEDDIRSDLEDLEETVKSYIAKIDELGKKKEEDIMSV